MTADERMMLYSEKNLPIVAQRLNSVYTSQLTFQMRCKFQSPKKLKAEKSLFFQNFIL